MRRDAGCRQRNPTNASAQAGHGKGQRHTLHWALDEATPHPFSNACMDYFVNLPRSEQAPASCRTGALLLYIAVEAAEGFKSLLGQFNVGGIDHIGFVRSARGAPQLTAVEHCQYLVDVDVQRLGCLFNGEVLVVAASHISLPVGL